MKNKNRNKIAKDLHTKKYRKRVVKAKKGKGSYNRKESRESSADFLNYF